MPRLRKLPEHYEQACTIMAKTRLGYLFETTETIVDHLQLYIEINCGLNKNMARRQAWRIIRTCLE